MMLYEVCFSTKDNQYEYLLDASTGRVESWRKAAIAEAVTEPAIAASGDLKPTASPEPTASPAPEKNATVLIGEDEANLCKKAFAILDAFCWAALTEN